MLKCQFCQKHIHQIIYGSRRDVSMHFRQQYVKYGVKNDEANLYDLHDLYDN